MPTRAHTCPHTREESCRFTKCCSRSLVCRVRCHPTRLLSSNFLQWQSTYNIKFTFSTVFKRAVQRHQVQSQSSAPGPTTHLAWLHRPGPRLGVSCPSPSPALASSALSTRPALSRVPRVTVHSGCGRACGQSSGGDAPHTLVRICQMQQGAFCGNTRGPPTALAAAGGSSRTRVRTATPGPPRPFAQAQVP